MKPSPMSKGHPVTITYRNGRKTTQWYPNKRTRDLVALTLLNDSKVISVGYVRLP